MEKQSFLISFSLHIHKTYLNHRTIFQTFVAILMLLLLTLIGLPSIKGSDKINCNVKDTLHYFYCSGQPQQFYLYVTYINIGLLIMYLICAVYNIFWIWFPHLRPGSLSSMVNNLKDEIESSVKDTDSLLDLEDMYFKNADMKLLLDLLATNSGIAPCINLLGLFDIGFRKILEVDNLKASCKVISDDKIDGIVSFIEPQLIGHILAKSQNTQCIYSVEISPAITSVSPNLIKLNHLIKTTYSILLPGFFLCSAVKTNAKS